MAEQEFQDLIIIKRRLSAEAEAVKGGVWKIAFADFMTAMMCFFLVMWLINAANEDTRQAVASYFNPVRLSELNRKGIADPRLAENTTTDNSEATLEEGEPPAPKPGAAGGGDGDAAGEARDELFRDPYRVLSEIAAEGAGTGAGDAAAAAAAAAGETPGSAGAGAGIAAYRDPFDPDIPAQLPAAAPDTGEQAAAMATTSEAESGSGTGTSESAAVEAETADDAPLSDAAVAMTAPSGSAGNDYPMSSPPGTAPQAPVAIPHSDAAGGTIQAEIAKAIRDSGGGQPGVAVEDTGEGVLISLTDGVDFGMFEIGSAEPQPETVRIMERIAEILEARPGKITIRGHTDARPFRGGGYDNWRLSTDRAQIAYYMLVRGGLDESRFLAIEGYADRRLKVPEDPDAAENRRIEILLHEDPQ